MLLFYRDLRNGKSVIIIIVTPKMSIILFRPCASALDKEKTENVSPWQTSLLLIFKLG